MNMNPWRFTAYKSLSPVLATQITSVVKWYWLIQFSFFLIHVGFGILMKPNMTIIDECCYLGLSRTIASFYIKDIVPPIWWAWGANLQPNSLFLLILSPAHIFHDYLRVKTAIVILNSIFVGIGVHAIYLTSVTLLRDKGGKLPLYAVAISHLSPFTNLAGFVMTESIYYCAFFWFVYLTIRYFDKVGVAIKNRYIETILYSIFCVTIYFIKPTFVSAPLFLLFAYPVFAYINNLSFKASISRLCLFSTLFFLFMIAAIWATNIPFLGRYKTVISIYNINHPIKILSTLIGSYINLFSYSSFFSFVALYIGIITIVQSIRTRTSLSMIDNRRLVFTLILLLALVFFPSAMSVHSVSHLEWAFPNENWYMFHERVYGFLIPLLSLLVMVYMDKLISYMYSVRLPITVIALSIFAIVILKGNAEPYSELFANPSYSLPAILNIKPKMIYFLWLSVFFLIWLVFKYPPIKRYASVQNNVYRNVIIMLLLITPAVSMASNFLRNYRLHYGVKAIPMNLHLDDTLYLKTGDQRPIFFTAMVDNRIKIVEGELPLTAGTKGQLSGRNLQFMSYSKFLNLLPTTIFFDSPAIDIYPQSDGVIASPALDVRYFSKFEDGTVAPLQIFGNLALISKGKAYPYVEIIGPSFWAVHPADDSDVILEFVNNGSISARFESLSLALSESPPTSDGVRIKVSINGNEIISKIISNTSQNLIQIGQIIPVGSDIKLVFNKNINTNYDKIYLRLVVVQGTN